MSISDGFNRADAGTLGANWTNLVSGLQVVSNACRAVNDNVYQPAVYTGSAWDSDQSSQVTLVSVSDAGVWLNGGAGPNGYMAMAHSGLGMRIYRCDAGSFTLLNDLGGSISMGDTIKLSRSGGTLTYYKNGVSQGTASDSTYTGGSPGAYVRFAGDSVDDWVGTGESAGGGGSTVGADAMQVYLRQVAGIGGQAA